MRLAVGLVACAACSQDPTFKPPPSKGAFASAMMFETTSGTQTISIAPTQDGDRVYVVLTGHGGGIDRIDAGDGFLFPIAAVDAGCRETQVWGSSRMSAGTSSITIHGVEGASYAGYALAFAGLSSNPVVVTGATDDWADGSHGDAHAPSLPAAPGDVMLAVVTTCDAAQPQIVASEFVALPPLDGADLAYAVMDGPGAGPSWHVGDAAWATYSLVLF